MCGIFAALNSQLSVEQLVFKSLKDLEYRGYDSWGLGIITKDQNLFITKDIGNLPIKPPPLPHGNLAFGHTRWATHGQVSLLNTHPHLDCLSQIAVVHNGIIENFEIIKSNLIQQGHIFKSETDTEVIAHLIEAKINQSNLDFVTAVRQVANQLKGLNSFLAIYLPTKELVAFKFGSPLVFGQASSASFLSSDTPALLKLTSSIYPLEDGEGIYLSFKQIQLLKLNSNHSFPIKTKSVSFIDNSSSKGHFKYYLLKEINDIPQVLKRLLDLPNSQLNPLVDLFKSTRNHYLVAAGTAHHANLLGSYFLAHSQISSFAYSAGEFSHFISTLSSKDLVLAASQSGETIDTLEAIRLAKLKGAKTAALVNVPASSLTRQVNFSFYLQAGREQAVLSTKAYVAKLVVFYLLSAALNYRLTQAKDYLADLLPSLERFFQPTYRRLVKNLAHKLSFAQNLYLLGRGFNYSTALEGALKIKEASYLHAEGFASSELKHGVIALIENKTPCLSIFAADATWSDSLSNALEVKARGAFLIGLSPRPHSSFDFYLPVPSVSDPQLSPLVNIIPLQLLAYELTLLRGFNPDRPRNLAKSVTVK